jgi:hypothetical protein
MLDFGQKNVASKRTDPQGAAVSAAFSPGRWLAGGVAKPPTLDAGLDLDQLGPSSPDFSHVAEMDRGSDIPDK